MSDLVIANKSELVDIADAIREKNGTSDPMTLGDMAGAIASIEGGGSASNYIADWNAKEGEPGHVLNRTHWEEIIATGGDTLTWDGNKDGLLSVDAGNTIMYHISDAVPTLDDCVNGTIVTYSNGTNQNVSFGAINAQYEAFGSTGLISLVGAIVCVPYDGFEHSFVSGTTTVFPKAGLWHMDNSNYVASITIPGYDGFPVTVVTTIDEKYIPNSIARLEDIPEGFSGSWNDLTDKPFVAKIHTIEDTLTTGTTGFTDEKCIGYLSGRKRYIHDGAYLIFRIGDDEGLHYLHENGEALTSGTTIVGDHTVSWTMKLDRKTSLYNLSVTTSYSDVIYASYNYPVGQVLKEEYIPDSIARVDDIPESFSGSWNDLTDKPFGEEIHEKVLYDGTVVHDDMIANENFLEIGKQYIVVYDGVTYKLLAFASEWGAPMLGASYKNGELITSECPVCIYDDEEVYVGIADQDEHTLRISEAEENIKKIDGKYLPNGVPYVESNVVEIVPKTMTSSASNEVFELFWQLYQVNVNLEVGKTYTIMYNETPYECVCQSALPAFTNDPNAVAIGNFSIAGGTDTGEPFALLYEPLYSQVSIIDLTGTTQNPVVGIYGEEEIAHKIDSRCLPDGLPYAERGITEVLLKTVVELNDEGAGALPLLNIVIGETYVVNWNGTEYECVAQDLSMITDDGGALLGNGSMVGMTGNDEPFFIASLPAEDTTVIAVFDGTVSTIIPLSIYKYGEVIHKLDPKYLPEALQFGEESVPGLKFTESDISNSSIKLSNGDGTFMALVTDTVYTEEDFSGLKIVYSYDNGESITETNPVINTDMMPDYLHITLPNGQLVALSTPGVPDGKSQGLWFSYYPDNEFKVISFEFANDTIIKTIDQKYLPEALQFGEGTTTVNEPLNITWDGNPDGLLSVQNMLYKVSDLVLTDEEIRLATSELSNGETFNFNEIWDELKSQGAVTEDVVDIFEARVVFARKDGAELEGLILPKAGIYFGDINGKRVSSLTTTESIEQTKTVVKTIDPKYLPSGTGGGAMRVNIVMSGADSYVADKTYAEISEAIANGVMPYCVFEKYIFNLAETDYFALPAPYMASANVHNFIYTEFGDYKHMFSITEYDDVWYETYEGMSEHFSCSWNDLTDRPFYKLEPFENAILLAETAIYIHKKGAYYPSNTQLSFEVGKSYKFILDGVEYISKAYEFTYPSTTDTAVVIGNTNLAHGSLAGNDLPFLVYKNNLYTSATGNHTVSIIELKENIVTLPEEYLPDSIATKQYVDEMLGVIENGSY